VRHKGFWADGTLCILKGHLITHPCGDDEKFLPVSIGILGHNITITPGVAPLLELTAGAYVPSSIKVTSSEGGVGELLPPPGLPVQRVRRMLCQRQRKGLGAKPVTTSLGWHTLNRYTYAVPYRIVIGIVGLIVMSHKRRRSFHTAGVSFRVLSRGAFQSEAVCWATCGISSSVCALMNDRPWPSSRSQEYNRQAVCRNPTHHQYVPGKGTL
jgi:hypothetical protein